MKKRTENRKQIGQTENKWNMDLNIPTPMVTLNVNDLNIPSSKPVMVGMDGSQTQFRQSMKCTVSYNNMKRFTIKHEKDIQILVLIVEYFSS